MIQSLEPVSIQTKQHERKAHVSVKHGNAPYYEAWQLRLATALDRYGSITDAARAYIASHGGDGDLTALKVSISRFKSGAVMAGGEWVCFLTDWMDKHPSP
jgi:hypothetical protein